MRELTELRTLTSKTFETDEGGRVEVHPRPIHYLREDGSWEEIDYTPFLEDGAWVVNAGAYTVKTIPGEVAVRFESEHSWCQVALQGWHPLVQPVIEEGKIRWNNISLDMDVYVDVYPDGFEFFKVVHSELADRELKWDVTYDEVAGYALAKSTQGEMYGWDADGCEIVCDRKIVDEWDGGFTLKEWYEPKVWFADEHRNMTKVDAVFPLTIDVPEISVSPGDPSQMMRERLSTRLSPAPSFPFAWNTFGFSSTEHYIDYSAFDVEWGQNLTYSPFSGYWYENRSRTSQRMMFHNTMLPHGARIDSATLELPVLRAEGKRAGGAYLATRRS